VNVAGAEGIDTLQGVEPDVVDRGAHLALVIGRGKGGHDDDDGAEERSDGEGAPPADPCDLVEVAAGSEAANIRML